MLSKYFFSIFTGLFFAKTAVFPPFLSIFSKTKPLYYPYQINFVGESMNYVKKMCILRQIKQGFSTDGKTLSGLIKAEQYGKNLAVEISVINFAPLASGDYYCLLSDGKGKTEMLCLRGKSLFNILTDMDITDGFCGIICHVKTEVVPIAYGVNGNGAYDWKTILNATLPPVFPKKEEKAESAATLAVTTKTPPQAPPSPTEKLKNYDDESLAENNYYEEKEDECKQPEQPKTNARHQSPAQIQDEKTGSNATENGDAARVLHPFKTDSDGYYHAVKAEIDELFATYPRDKTLNGAFSCSDWVRVKGTAKDPQYLVGVLFFEGKAKYICYALYTEDKNNPPDEIKNVCAFVPLSVYDTNRGFFVIFQSAASGECVKPEQV